MQHTFHGRNLDRAGQLNDLPHRQVHAELRAHFPGKSFLVPLELTMHGIHLDPTEMTQVR